MSNSFNEFKAMHESEYPLMIGNVWNAKSAVILEKMGYKAIGTSSYAIAESMGFADGQNISFDLYFSIIEGIANSTNLPLSVDLEGGYGNNYDEILSNIIRLHHIGVIGINIEDSIIVDGKRMLEDANSFNKRLKAITEDLKYRNIHIFINVRCDAFLLDVPNKIEEAKNRIKLYQTNDIHGLFLPCLTSLEEIATMVNFTSLPINLLGLPNLPNFEELKKIGVKRISIGNFLFNKVYKNMEDLCDTINLVQNFNSLF